VDLASLEPAQQAATLASRADLTDDTGWCPIDPTNFESLRQRHIHVLGDASAGAPMPKSAFAANSQAKLCASAIAADLRGAAPPAARLLNTCYSMVSGTEAISVSGLYAAAAGKLGVVSEGTSPLAADASVRRREAREARAWYEGMTVDSFGAADEHLKEHVDRY
jgi:sulfide dehydrogenase [flavocytochrome c] flavoprotein subunit